MRSSSKMLSYSRPLYFSEAATTSVLSEIRPLEFSPAALTATNYLVDELLQLFLHAALAPADPTSTQRILQAGEHLTTERFKNGVLKVVGTHLGKGCVVEAELSIRLLLEFEGNGSSGNPDTSVEHQSISRGNDDGGEITAQVQEEAMFRTMRNQIMLLNKTQTPSLMMATAAAHLTPIDILYAERCLRYLGVYFIRSFGRVCERSSCKDVVGLEEVMSALGENNTVWSFIQRMRVRSFIEIELAAERRNTGSITLNHSSSFRRPARPQRIIPLSDRSLTSSNNTTIGADVSRQLLVKPLPTSASAKVTQEMERRNSIKAANPSEREEFTRRFEVLMRSDKTMKVSLTPTRIKEDFQHLFKRRLPTPTPVPAAVLPAPLPPPPILAAAPSIVSQALKVVEAPGKRASSWVETTVLAALLSPVDLEIPISSSPTTSDSPSNYSHSTRSSFSSTSPDTSPVLTAFAIRAAFGIYDDESKIPSVKRRPRFLAVQDLLLDAPPLYPLEPTPTTNALEEKANEKVKEQAKKQAKEQPEQLKKREEGLRIADSPQSTKSSIWRGSGGSIGALIAKRRKMFGGARRESTSSFPTAAPPATLSPLLIQPPLVPSVSEAASRYSAAARSAAPMPPRLTISTSSPASTPPTVSTFHSPPSPRPECAGPPLLRCSTASNSVEVGQIMSPDRLLRINSATSSDGSSLRSATTSVAYSSPPSSASTFSASCTDESSPPSARVIKNALAASSSLRRRSLPPPIAPPRRRVLLMAANFDSAASTKDDPAQSGPQLLQPSLPIEPVILQTVSQTRRKAGVFDTSLKPLEALKVLMAQATTKEECMQLVDDLIKLSNGGNKVERESNVKMANALAVVEEDDDGDDSTLGSTEVDLPASVEDIASDLDPPSISSESQPSPEATVLPLSDDDSLPSLAESDANPSLLSSSIDGDEFTHSPPSFSVPHLRPTLEVNFSPFDLDFPPPLPCKDIYVPRFSLTPASPALLQGHLSPSIAALIGAFQKKADSPPTMFVQHGCGNWKRMRKDSLCLVGEEVSSSGGRRT